MRHAGRRGPAQKERASLHPSDTVVFGEKKSNDGSYF